MKFFVLHPFLQSDASKLFGLDHLRLETSRAPLDFHPGGLLGTFLNLRVSLPFLLFLPSVHFELPELLDLLFPR